jgi:hypothetical protein
MAAWITDGPGAPARAIPYYLLEDEFEVLLVNAAHLKDVPGRETDVIDAQWIAEILSFGLLRPASCRRGRSSPAPTSASSAPSQRSVARTPSPSAGSATCAANASTID